MMIWAWLFFLAVNTCFIAVLWRAWRRNYFKIGPVIWSLADDPFYFWFWALVVGASELFALAFFVLLTASAISGPIVHQ